MSAKGVHPSHDRHLNFRPVWLQINDEADRGRHLRIATPRFSAKFIQRAEMWSRSPLIVVILSAAIVVATSYVTYRLVDPLPPRHLAIAAGAAGSGYDNVARQYARILARNGVDWRSVTLLAPWRILIGYAMPPPGSRPPLRLSASRNRPMRISSIPWVEYSIQRYLFFTGTRSLLRFLRSSVASGFRSVSREPRCDCLCWKF